MALRKTFARSEIHTILAAYRSGDLSQRAFAAQNGISANTLAFWLRRDRLESKPVGETTLVAVAPSQSLPPDVFILEAVSGGFRVEVPRDATVDEWRRLREALAAT